MAKRVLSEETKRKDRIRAREWIRRKRENDPESRRRRQLHDELVAEFGAGCAICGDVPKEGARRLAIDHCHASDEIRGLLCWNCNLLLGNARDSVDILRAAVAYLQRDTFTGRKFAEVPSMDGEAA